MTAALPGKTKDKRGWMLRCAAVVALSTSLAAAAAAQQGASTAWKSGHFEMNRAALLSAADVVLARPNLRPGEAMPLGNGALGAAVWSAQGLTVQLNRSDTMPHRLSAGQVVVPGLRQITRAADYKGRLDLYDGEFVETGGGMTARVYVESRTDTLVIDVAGASPGQKQTAELALWAPRAPSASAAGPTGELAETWKDTGEPGASGRPFGSLAAITGTGRDVSATVKDARTVMLSLRPDARGHFAIRVAAPHYDGTQTPAQALAAQMKAQPIGAHRGWWHAYWQRAHLIAADSSDGAAQYMENLRNLYLFYAAADKGSEFPGSQAGIADMLSAVRDAHKWDPAAFWHWNLRMQVAANLSAGLPELNAPYFRLYRTNLSNMEAWTRQHMAGRVGVCVPETVRFNGMGIEYEQGQGWGKPVEGLDCAADSPPYYNARTISTGAEVGFWVWQQYLQTGDPEFLRQNYPVMREAARFLLDYQKPGRDGLLHTSPSNAHETQWDVTDPVTDIAGMRTLYANTAAAAEILGKDAELSVRLKAALEKLPPLPRTQQGRPESVLTVSADSAGQDVLATSYFPAAPQQNVENLGLEPVWPYGLMGEDSPQAALARRTFRYRPYPVNQDWSFDPLQAARLGLGAEVGSTLVKLTEKYQLYPNGLASWGGNSGEFYIEQSGVVADALSEALVQDYNGVIRIAPAIPPGWNMAGTVAIPNRSAVAVQVENGTVTTAVIESGMKQTLRVESPWLNATMAVTDTSGRAKVPTSADGRVLVFAASAGHAYRLTQPASTSLPFAPVTATRATEPRRLGSREIGLDVAGR